MCHARIWITWMQCNKQSTLLVIILVFFPPETLIIAISLIFFFWTPTYIPSTILYHNLKPVFDFQTWVWISMQLSCNTLQCQSTAAGFGNMKVLIYKAHHKFRIWSLMWINKRNIHLLWAQVEQHFYHLTDENSEDDISCTWRQK